MDAGEKIMRERIKRGWTQKELAKRMGIAAQTVCNFEVGYRDLRISTIMRAASALGVEPASLLPDYCEEDCNEKSRNI